MWKKHAHTEAARYGRSVWPRWLNTGAAQDVTVQLNVVPANRYIRMTTAATAAGRHGGHEHIPAQPPILPTMVAPPLDEVKREQSSSSNSRLATYPDPVEAPKGDASHQSHWDREDSKHLQPRHSITHNQHPDAGRRSDAGCYDSQILNC